jgi:lipopolysaccharide transport system ATP-binding protein
MSDIAIKVENISKLYQIGDTSSGSLRETIVELFSPGKNRRTEDFWALQDLSFEVKRGEALGIIGKNGAGKSTLLKVLSRITEPSRGRIEIDGRISSLLEVGTGFHPELTGRENIFLNGTILGMSRAEVRAKFDEIVDFSGVEKFLDTPVKRYSSGMKVRLAFAVAAHLEPEILIIDEVLAVGDAEFQKKCLEKMEDVAGQGRTILFVSHNMNAVRQLCSKSLLLRHGKLEALGEVQDMINLYLEKNQSSSRRGVATFEVDPDKDFQLVEARLTNDKLDPKSTFECEEEIKLFLTCRSKKHIPGLYGYLTIKDKDDNLLVETDTYDYLPNVLEELPRGISEIAITIPKRLLSPGQYYIYLNFSSKQNMDGFHVESPGNILSFDVVDSYTIRGNNRKSFLGTTLKWNLSLSEVHSQEHMK